MIFLFLVAVLEIPYRRSTEVIVKIEKDGGWYFLALFGKDWISLWREFVHDVTPSVIHLICIFVLAFGKVTLHMNVLANFGVLIHDGLF